MAARWAHWIHLSISSVFGNDQCFSVFLPVATEPDRSPEWYSQLLRVLHIWVGTPSSKETVKQDDVLSGPGPNVDNSPAEVAQDSSLSARIKSFWPRFNRTATVPARASDPTVESTNLEFLNVLQSCPLPKLTASSEMVHEMDPKVMRVLNPSMFMGYQRLLLFVSLIRWTKYLNQFVREIGLPSNWKMTDYEWICLIFSDSKLSLDSKQQVVFRMPSSPLTRASSVLWKIAGTIPPVLPNLVWFLFKNARLSRHTPSSSAASLRRISLGLEPSRDDMTGALQMQQAWTRVTLQMLNTIEVGLYPSLDNIYSSWCRVMNISLLAHEAVAAITPKNSVVGLSLVVSRLYQLVTCALHLGQASVETSVTSDSSLLSPRQYLVLLRTRVLQLLSSVDTQLLSTESQAVFITCSQFIWFLFWNSDRPTYQWVNWRTQLDEVMKSMGLNATVSSTGYPWPVYVKPVGKKLPQQSDATVAPSNSLMYDPFDQDSTSASEYVRRENLELIHLLLVKATVLVACAPQLSYISRTGTRTAEANCECGRAKASRSLCPRCQAQSGLLRWAEMLQPARWQSSGGSSFLTVFCRSHIPSSLSHVAKICRAILAETPVTVPGSPLQLHRMATIKAWLDDFVHIWAVASHESWQQHATAASTLLFQYHGSNSHHDGHESKITPVLLTPMTLIALDAISPKNDSNLIQLLTPFYKPDTESSATPVARLVSLEDQSLRRQHGGFSTATAAYLLERVWSTQSGFGPPHGSNLRHQKRAPNTAADRIRFEPLYVPPTILSWLVSTLSSFGGGLSPALLVLLSRHVLQHEIPRQIPSNVPFDATGHAMARDGGASAHPGETVWMLATLEDNSQGAHLPSNTTSFFPVRFLMLIF
jgi:hypothetical protein